MRSIKMPVLGVAIAVAGCSTHGPIVLLPGPDVTVVAADNRAATAATLGIPPGHLPPPGECRVWIPGQPPGQQRPPGDCLTLQRRVPPGAWLIYRPGRDRKVVEVSVYGDRRDAGVWLIRIFDFATGRLLREERPGAD